MSGEFAQIACIFCGRNRPLKSGFSLGAMTIAPAEYGVITIRAVGPGPGRGHKGERGEGFRTIGRLNIREALEDPQYSDIAGQVRDRLIAIVRSYMEAGVLTIEDLTG
ncbi:hypothetical protein LCGC14_1127400 [marine sediment metagenome]|uniref:Uncharacterized protein n=1 Tax=marine sediment metagenome TaxID=412755 RepID=A0A0F9M6X6_9ZZZZ